MHQPSCICKLGPSPMKGMGYIAEREAGQAV